PSMSSPTSATRDHSPSSSVHLQYPPRPVLVDSRTSQTSRTGSSTPVASNDLEITDPLYELMNDNAIQQAFELEPVDHGRGAWTFVACSFVMEVVAIGFPSSFGVFQDYYVKNPPFDHASEAAINSIGTIALALQYTVIIWVISLYHKYPQWSKTMTFLGLVTCALSLLLASFANAVWELILSQGVMFGIGASFLYAPVLVYISEWFVERRAFAASIIFAGTALGGAVFPFVINSLIQHVGLRKSLIILAGAILSIGGLVVPGMKPRVPVATATARSSRARHAQGSYRNYDYRVLKRPIFYVLSLTVMSQSFGYYPVPFYLPTYATAAGLSTSTGTSALAVFNLSTVVGQVIAGYIYNKLGYGPLMVLSATGSAAAAWLIWGFAHSAGVLFVFAAVFGSISGAFNTTYVPASSDLAEQSPEEVSFIMGALGIFKSIAIIGGPLVSSALHSTSSLYVSAAGSVPRYGGYGFTSVIVFVGSVLTATCFGGLLTMFLRVKGH
ncbi:MFS general substrate transporter, partial [Clavulina sp. PMI_390]